MQNVMSSAFVNQLKQFFQSVEFFLNVLLKVHFRNFLNGVVAHSLHKKDQNLNFFRRNKDDSSFMNKKLLLKENAVQIVVICVANLDHEIDCTVIIINLILLLKQNSLISKIIDCNPLKRVIINYNGL